MKEYTGLAIASVVMAVIVDRRLGADLFRQGRFYLFLLVILFFKLLVNGYLTGARVVIYNPAVFLGYRIGSIPLEDFLFGLSMVTLTIVFWEYFKKKLP